MLYRKSTSADVDGESLPAAAVVVTVKSSAVTESIGVDSVGGGVTSGESLCISPSVNSKPN